MRPQPDEVVEVTFDDGTVGFYTSCDEDFLDTMQEYRSVRVLKKSELQPIEEEVEPTREELLQEAYQELDAVEFTAPAFGVSDDSSSASTE